MEFFSDLIREGQAVWLSKSECFIAIRKDGFDKAVKEYATEFEGLSKNELEERRHEHRARRRVMAEKIDDARLAFLSYYIICSVTLYVWAPLVVLFLFDALIVKYGLLVMIFLLVLNTVLFGLSAVLIRKQGEKATESYQILGFAEGMISLADYRELEKFDLTRLPDLESILEQTP